MILVLKQKKAKKGAVKESKRREIREQSKL